MKTCTLCASTLDAGASACPNCGIATPRARRPPRPSRLARTARAGVVAFAGLAVLGALALPVIGRVRGGQCEPHSWADWHVAMARACLTPDYVCENMTSAKMLEDPQLAAELRHALRAGRGGALAHLDALVAHVREAYGCASSDASRPAPALDPPDPRLPPGHPPVPATPAPPIFQAPPSLTI